MSIRRSSVLRAGSILVMLPALLCGQETVPDTFLNALGSEVFRDRAQAQLDLVAWAQSRPKNQGEDLLLAAHDAALEPEIRLRLRAALKEIVIAEHQKDGKGYVGIRMQEIDVVLPGTNEARVGVQITEVNKDTPASKAGLVAGDVIVAIGELRWPAAGAVEAFAEEVKRHKAGDKVVLEVLSGAELKKVEITLAARPMGMPEVRGLIWPGGLIEPLEDLEVLEKRAQDEYFERWLARKRAQARGR